jgi:hypothetical protein
MNRETKLKATASALQPDSLDLTQFAKARAASFEQEMHIRSTDAAGAMAFAAMDQFQDADGNVVAPNDPCGVRVKGDPLAVLLLRLKYADAWNREVFNQAHLILARRYGGLYRRRSETFHAVSLVALFEWIHDACTTCRGQRQGMKATRCPVCPQPPKRQNDRAPYRAQEFQTANGVFEAASLAPNPGCPKCNGMGRIFEKPKRPKGMRCLSCHNTGRKNLTVKQRHKLVNEYLTDSQRARGLKAVELTLGTFADHWHARFYRVMDVLRQTDKRIVENLDLRVRGSARSDAEAPSTDMAEFPDE